MRYFCFISFAVLISQQHLLHRFSSSYANFYLLFILGQTGFSISSRYVLVLLHFSPSFFCLFLSFCLLASSPFSGFQPLLVSYVHTVDHTCTCIAQHLSLNLAPSPRVLVHRLTDPGYLFGNSSSHPIRPFHFIRIRFTFLVFSFSSKKNFFSFHA